MKSSLLPLHLITLAITAVAIVIADHDAFAYMRGKKETLSPRRVKTLHYSVWAGLLLMIITGGIMAYPVWRVLFSNTSFLIKMAFVGILFVNAIVIHFLSDLATKKPFAALSHKEKMFLMISGALSTIGWFGAAITAFIIFG